MRPLAARCHLGLGKAHRQRADRTAARADLATAVDMLRAMEMTYWLADAESELAVVSTSPERA